MSNFLKITIVFCTICNLFSSCTNQIELPESQTSLDREIKIESTQKRSPKRGVAYNFDILSDVDLLAPGVSWYYNWGNDIPSNLNTLTNAKDMKFFPMTWNRSFDKDKIRHFKQNNPKCEYILAYNEPNLTDQANMTPSFAAERFYEVLDLAKELHMKVISPAMNYGTLPGYGDPIKWLDEFFALIPKDNFAGIALHCYMPNAAWVKGYVRLFKKYNLPIWLTEFCSWEPGMTTAAQQLSYASDMVNYLETSSDIAYYAWFMPRMNEPVDAMPYNQLLTKTQPYQLTALGNLYVNMSSFDKSTYFAVGQTISAAHYSSLNMAETSNSDTWTSSVIVRRTSDNSGNLEITQFDVGYWVEYLIDIPETKIYKVDFRHASVSNAKIEVRIDNSNPFTIDLQKTGQQNIWTTSTLDMNLPKGKHTLRLKMLNGTTSLNWFRFR